MTGWSPQTSGFGESWWWRGRDSNPRPLGYEPNELPLLHPASGAVAPLWWSGPGRPDGAPTANGQPMSGSRGARSGLASHRIAPAVLSGAAAGHDRVRDGTGWGHRALGHGHPPTSTSVRYGCDSSGSRFVSWCLLIVREASFVEAMPFGFRPRSAFPSAVSRLGNGAQTPACPASWFEMPSLIRTGRLRSFACRPPPAYKPGRLPGSLPVSPVGCVVLGRDSRLDAFSGSPIRT